MGRIVEQNPRNQGRTPRRIMDMDRTIGQIRLIQEKTRKIMAMDLIIGQNLQSQGKTLRRIMPTDRTKERNQQNRRKSRQRIMVTAQKRLHRMKMMFTLVSEKDRKKVLNLKNQRTSIVQDDQIIQQHQPTAH